LEQPQREHSIIGPSNGSGGQSTKSINLFADQFHAASQQRFIPAVQTRKRPWLSNASRRLVARQWIWPKSSCQVVSSRAIMKFRQIARDRRAGSFLQVLIGPVYDS
jgi:hypothetical protein